MLTLDLADLADEGSGSTILPSGSTSISTGTYRIFQKKANEQFIIQYST